MKNPPLAGRARIEPLETRIAPAFVTGTIALSGLSGGDGSAFHGANAGDYAGSAVSAAGDVNGDGFGDFIVGAAKAGGTGAAYVIFGTAAGFLADVTLDAAFLDGTKGFQLLGEASGDRAGAAVGAAGDVNGDGFDDVIVGAHFATGAVAISGAAYVVFGKAGGFAAQVPLGSLDGASGFKLSGEALSDRAGHAVSGAGDVNGDGFDDVLVGAYRVGGKGAAFIIYGKAGGFAANLTLSGLTTAQGVQLNGVASGNQAGRSVSGAGDVNGDGFADVVVGAPLADQIGNDNRGAAYVVFGGNALAATIELVGLGGSSGFRAEGAADKDYAGLSVGSAGDVNGDGFADVLVGASRDGAGSAFSGPGAAYVIFGDGGIFAPRFDLGTTGGTITLTGAAGDVAGFSVSGAGDVNGDGIDDLIVGAPQVTVAGGTGGAYVVFGRANIATAPPTLATLDGSNGFQLAGEEAASQTGFAVSGAGDVNGDGFADVLVSTPLSDDGGTDIGKTYLVLGGPSGAFINPTIATGGKTATFTDVDGDLVTVKVSKGALANGNFQLIKASATAPGAQLLSLTLGVAFDGADVSITAKRAGGGDGKVNVGFLDATGVDLGKVTISGDLGRIEAGDTVSDLSVKSLTVGSFGLFEGRTEDTGIGLISTIKGAVGPLKVAGDMRADFNVERAGGAAAGANLASVTIGGSLLGGKVKFAGDIYVLDHLGPVKITGDVRGGAGQGTGFIGATGITSVTVGGSVVGGSGVQSGEVISNFGAIGPVTIGGSLVGGSGSGSGSIIGSEFSIGKVTIKGDLVGGTATLTGVISTDTPGANIAGVTIGGDARGGSVPSSGGIFAGRKLGPVVIGGDVIGTAAEPFTIRGVGALTGATSLAVTSVKVKGDFERALILGGYGTSNSGFDNAPVNGHAQIGAITVGGDWIASSVAAGVLTNAGATNAAGIFGNGDDVFIGAGPANVVANIQSVTIKGAARGTFEDGDRFAIVAEHIGFVSIGGKKLPLDPAIASDLAGIAVGATPDFVVREVSRTTAAPTPTFTPTPAAGPRSALPATVDLSTLGGTKGFTIGTGIFGAVSSVGDVNGDGFDDVAVCDYHTNSDQGTVYVVFGQAGGFTANVPLSALDGTKGFTLTGAAAGDKAGRSVAAAGDVNGDGFDDIIVGAISANAAYVVFGANSFAGTIGLGTLNGANGFKLSGAAGDNAGLSVGGGVDVNSDGLDDVIVGSSGEAYVVFGQKKSAATLALGTLDGSAGFKLTGPGSAGFFVGGAGDVNGDGRGDVIVGSRNTAAAWVLFGADDFASTPAIDLAALNGADGFTISDLGGFDNNVSAAGDVNGDGFADVIVGASTVGTPASGAAYVIFGKASFTSAPSAGFAIVAANLNGTDGFTLTGTAAGDNAGRALSGGDVNGDGFSDLIVGAYRADVGHTDNGEAYVVFGKPGGFAASMALASVDGANGFKLPGLADNEENGFFVSTAGDVNGDGYTDFILGPRGYVVFGGPSGEFIVPTISPDTKTITWTDVDGDLVTLKFSRGSDTVLDPGTIKLLAKSTTDSRAQLLALNLGADFEGADVSITAKRMPGGDGKVNVGFLNAANVDLGKVTIGGDLGRIAVGDGDAVAPFKSLTVGSLGVFGGRTQDTGGSLNSNIFGPAGAVKIAGDVREALIAVGAAGIAGNGTLASITIGGSLIGGKTAASGAIAANSLGPVKIGGDLVGGAGQQSGYLQAASLTSLTLGGDLRGGSGIFSGNANISGNTGNVSIGGSQLGGSGPGSGALFITGSLGKVAIKRDQIGGAGSASALIFTSVAGSNITSVTIGGDARGGDAAFSGGILAGGTLGPVSIKGDVIGTAGQAYLIRGAGPLAGGLASVAIASLKVGGDFERALVLAGYGADNVPTNGRAQIGAISVGGDWIASSVTAGLLPFAGALNATGVFGNGDDKFIAAGPPGLVASIASITIKGRAVGSLETGDRFGIVAQQIGSVTIGGVKLALTPGLAAAGFAIGPTPDFFVREVARV